ncbi:flagellin [Sulfurimonas sp.]
MSAYMLANIDVSGTYFTAYSSELLASSNAKWAAITNDPANATIYNNFESDMDAAAGNANTPAEVLADVQAVIDTYNTNYPITNATGTTSSFTFHTGAYTDDTQSVEIGSMATSDTVGTISVLTQADAESAITSLDTALKTAAGARATLGAAQNKLESTIRNISVTQVNLESAESGIRDVDFAAESANFAKQSIMSQSGSYAMSQANTQPESVMRILESSA